MTTNITNTSAAEAIISSLISFFALEGEEMTEEQLKRFLSLNHEALLPGEREILEAHWGGEL
jgi:hypothetical protein